MTTRVHKTITLADPAEVLSFCGHHDRRLRKIQGRMKAKIVPRGNEIRFVGEPEDVDYAFQVIQELLKVQRSRSTPLTDQQLHHALTDNADPAETTEMLLDTIPVPNRKLRLTPLTKMQHYYVEQIRNKDITICTGPAGTGKTYLAMALAVSHLIDGSVQRIILVRPVVEAGEHLGFLPGDIAQKFDPYVRPLYDAVYEMMEADRIREYIDTGTIEIAPLAYMRGRTLNRSFIILDEAQNTTAEQMKMFLTRMGFGSKMVVTGDITQTDLPQSKPSGLAHVQSLLGNIEEIGFVNFTRADVVRHSLVQKIIEAYENQSAKQ